MPPHNPNSHKSTSCVLTAIRKYVRPNDLQTTAKKSQTTNPKNRSANQLVIRPNLTNLAAKQQRWPELLFQTPNPLLFQHFLIRVRIRVRQFFKFENPTPVQTPATIINPTLNYLCFYLRNDHTDSCYWRDWRVTPIRVRFFLNFWLQIRIRIRKKNVESCRSRLRLSGSGPTSVKRPWQPWWTHSHSLVNLIYQQVSLQGSSKKGQWTCHK